MSYEKIALTVLEKEISGISAIKSIINKNFDNIIDSIKSRTGRLIVSGIGKSGQIGLKFTSTLCSTGTQAYFIHPAEASHGDLGMISPDDTIIVISNSGETKELFDLIHYCKRHDNNLISITSNPDSTIAKNSKLNITLPKADEACPLGLAPTTSTSMTLVLCDIIAVCLYENFSKETFSSFHPGGKLGRKLFKVSDLMHSEDKMPKVYTNSSAIEAILEMTSKHFGVTSVVDENHLTLVGVITDGDLRRNIGNFENKTAFEVMNNNPVIVNENMLAAEALRIMNEKKITCLFITDKYSRPQGILHIHDCLNAGVDE